MKMTYEKWFDRVGYILTEQWEDQWNELPPEILKQLKRVDIDEVIGDALEEAYESYLSDYDDRAYDEWKDGRLC
jgi:hypothetical protein